MDLASAYVLCCLDRRVLDFEVTQYNGSGRNGSPEYSRPERDREDSVSKGGQDLVGT